MVAVDAREDLVPLRTDFDRSWRGYDTRQVREYVLSVEADLRLVRARFDVLTTLRQRFYTALAAQRLVQVLEELVGIAAKSRDIGQRLLKGGEGTRTDAILLDTSELNIDAAFAVALALVQPRIEEALKTRRRG